MESMFTKSHSLQAFADGEGSSAGDELETFQVGIAGCEPILSEARGIFIETVLVKAIGKVKSNEPKLQEEGKTLIRDQLNDISEGIDGVGASFVQQQLFKAAQDLLGPN